MARLSGWIFAILFAYQLCLAHEMHHEHHHGDDYHHSHRHHDDHHHHHHHHHRHHDDYHHHHDHQHHGHHEDHHHGRYHPHHDHSEDGHLHHESNGHEHDDYYHRFHHEHDDRHHYGHDKDDHHQYHDGHHFDHDAHQHLHHGNHHDDHYHHDDHHEHDKDLHHSRNERDDHEASNISSSDKETKDKSSKNEESKEQGKKKEQSEESSKTEDKSNESQKQTNKEAQNHKTESSSKESPETKSAPEGDKKKINQEDHDLHREVHRMIHGREPTEEELKNMKNKKDDHITEQKKGSIDDEVKKMQERIHTKKKPTISEEERKKIHEHIEHLTKHKTSEYIEQLREEEKAKKKEHEELANNMHAKLEQWAKEEKERTDHDKVNDGKGKELPKDIEHHFKKSDKVLQEERRKKKEEHDKLMEDFARIEKELGMAANSLFPQAKKKLEIGVKLLLQTYTVLLHSGKNCYHQSVLADSNMTIYYMAMDNEGVPVTVLDTNEKILQQIPSNRSGTINIKAKANGMYDVCFTNYRWRARKVFVVFEVEPLDSKTQDPNLTATQRAFNGMIVNMRRMNALIQYKKSKWSIDNDSQNEYVSLMNQRSWCMVLLAIVIYILQVYAIHRVFRMSPNGRMMALDKMPYRMKV